MNLVVVTPPTVEPVSLAEAKAQLRVDDTSEDTLIGTYVTAARQKCEEISRRAFVTQTLALVMDCWPEKSIVKLPRPPLASITSVTYKDYAGAVTTWASSNYVLDTASEPGRLALASGAGWPGVSLYPIGGLKFTYVAGYGLAAAVPQNYKQAVLLLTAVYFQFRDMGAEVPAGVKSILMADRGWYL